MKMKWKSSGWSIKYYYTPTAIKRENKRNANPLLKTLVTNSLGFFTFPLRGNSSNTLRSGATIFWLFERLASSRNIAQ